jgi:pentatricopeptide repeat protein
MKILLKALEAEGMVKELLQYLHVAEDHFNSRDAPGAPLLETNMYNSVLHALVEAKEWDVAVDIFENMKAFGFKPDAATYHIMMDCSSLTGDLQSARALMATMLQIVLANDDFEAAINLLNEMKDEGIHSDVLSYNTILSSASARGRLDIIELLVEHMHRENIQPDPDTCLLVFSSYYERGLIDTALEALQVLSVRTISDDETVQREMQSNFQALVLDEDSQVEESFMEIFNDSKEYLAAALFNMRFCALSGVPNSWIPDKSPWAIQLRLQYDQIVS